MPSKLNDLKDFLSFSKGERNGIIALLIIILILLLAPLFYKTFFISMPKNNQEFYTKVDSFFLTLKSKPEEVTKPIINHIENEEIGQNSTKTYFYFDPNTVSVSEMMQLGLSLKQASVIDKYRNKGGRFHSPEDFSKMYVLDSLLYKQLKPWIKVSEVSHNKPQPEPRKDSIKLTKKAIIVELNTTDTLELVKIKGIGRTFARRIIAYRNLLGGYVNLRQLGEVYGIQSELLKSISSQITVDSSKIKLINLNLISFEDLKKHPYLSEYQAKGIIYYRGKVGNIKSSDELLKNKILPPEKYRIIKSYLTTF